MLIALTFFLMGCQDGGNQAKEATLPSGYKYIRQTEGTGQKANPGDVVFFHYYMRKQDSIIASSREQGPPPVVQIPDSATAQAREMSPVEEVLQITAVGDCVTIFVPLDTLPVEQRPPGFEEEEVLYYDVVMTDVKTMAEVQAEQQEFQNQANEIGQLVAERLETYKSGGFADALQTTDSGIEYVIHEEGNGESPSQGDMVTVKYYGVLEEDGTMFDNSFERGEPIEFPMGVGAVIRGWDVGLSQLQVGDKATLFIPYEQAYGEAGRPPAIPERSDLVFYVELIDVKPDATQ